MKKRRETADTPGVERARGKGQLIWSSNDSLVGDAIETATAAPIERAVSSRRTNRAEPYTRANPRRQPVKVIRAWPGVRNGQLVVLRPDAERRLILGGFVEPV